MLSYKNNNQLFSSTDSIQISHVETHNYNKYVYNTSTENFLHGSHNSEGNN